MKKILACVAGMIVGILLGIAIAHAHTWIYITPGGIRVTAAEKVIRQYEARWDLSWSWVDWDKLDNFFYTVKGFVISEGANGIEDIEPSKLRIKIHPWNGCGPGDRVRMSCGYMGCCQAWYSGGTIHLHLGQEDAYGSNAWCDTPLTHELTHFFLFKAKNKCKWKIDSSSHPECRHYDPGAWGFLDLCGRADLR